MTPEEDDIRAGYWTEEPFSPKWMAEKELEPWDNLVCSMINQSIEDIFDPKIHSEHILKKYDRASMTYKQAAFKFKKSVSKDAEDFFFSEDLDYWVASLSTPLDPNIIRRAVIKMMTERASEVEALRGEPIMIRSIKKNAS